MKPDCLFIDHAYHRKTRSTLFLREQLSEAYTVTDFWLEDYSTERLQELLDTPAELYLVFQQDFLVRFLTSNGRRVLSVPMYDGTGEIGPEHWLTQTDALILNHSSTLHRVVTALGLASIVQRYYPESCVPEDAIQEDFHADVPAVFFWERQPSSGIDVRWLARTIAGQHVPYVHLHLAADPGETSTVSAELASRLFPDSEVVTSSWFPTRAEYQAAMRRCNVFVCPRAYEGIGFGFLEALSLGMTVIGLDHPTLNEYVTPGVNGILLRSLSDPLPTLVPAMLRQMGQGARQSVIEGRQAWLHGRPAILDAIEAFVALPAPVRTPMTAGEAAQLCQAFFDGIYIYLNYLADTAPATPSAYVRQRDFKRRLAWKAFHLTRHYPAFQSLLKGIAARVRR